MPNVLATTEGLKGKSVWSIADNFAQQALSFLIFAVLARWLSPQEFGLLAIAHLMVLFARVAVLDALAMPVTRAPQAGDAMFDWLFTLCTVASLAMAGLLALLSVPLARFFGAPDLLGVLLGMSLVIVFYGLVRAHEARLLREGNFRLLAIRSICAVSAGGIVALVLAHRGAGALALVAQQLTTTGVALLIAVAAEWRRWRPRWRWSMPQLRQNAGEMSHVSGTAILSYATSYGDAAVVSVLLGPHATGVYNLAKRVMASAYLVIGSSISRVAISLFVQQQATPAVLRDSYARMVSLTLVLLAPIYVVASALSEPLVVTVFGPQWRESAPLFSWLAVACIAQAGFGLGQNLSFATDRAPRVSKLAFAQLVIAGALSLAMSRWGALGVAVGFALAGLSGMLAMQTAVNRQLAMPLKKMASTLLPALCGSALAWAALAALPRTGLAVNGWWSLAAASGAGLLAYAATAALVHHMTNRPSFVQ